MEVALPEAVIAIAAGGVHTCALLAGGSTRCWGGNDHGQLGDGSALDRSSPVVANVASLQSPVTALSLGATHSCASTLHGGALCWGGNASAQVGDATRIDRTAPFFVTGFSAGASRVVAGNAHSCALSSSGEMYCWGAGGLGQLASNDGSGDRLTPTGVATFGPRLLDLATGGDSTCAITESGEARCWGRNDFGQLGDTNFFPHPVPTEVAGLAAMRRIAIGPLHACGVSMATEVFCWGYNDTGQLGLGFAGPIAPANRVPRLTGVQQIAVGGSHTCAILVTGLLQCWGSNYYGQIGDGQTVVDNLIPTPTPLIGRALAVAAGLVFTCAIDAPGIVYCWGANRFGQLGDGTTVDRVTPVIVSALPQDIVSLSAALASTCAVSGAVGALYCWGYNNDGQLGVTGAMMYTTPTLVIASGVASVTMGNNHACAVMRDGGLRCWGGIGTIGNGSGSGSYAPAPVRSGQWIDFTVPALIDVDTSVTLAVSALGGGTVVVDRWTPDQCSVSIFGPLVFASAPATCGLRARQGGGNLVAHGSPAPAPRQLRQTWVPKAYFVRPNVAGSDGTVSPDVPTAVREGDTLALTVTAAAGFFPTIETQCGGALVGGVYTTARLFADCNALFRFSTSAVAGSCFDIDGSGSASAAIDGVLLNRYLAGIRGDALVAGLTGLGPRRTGAAIEAFFGNAARYDVIGRAVPSPSMLVDGLILSRLMQGFSAAELLTGIDIPAGARYRTASAIMQHVAEICAVTSVP